MIYYHVLQLMLFAMHEFKIVQHYGYDSILTALQRGLQSDYLTALLLSIEISINLKIVLLFMNLYELVI